MDMLYPLISPNELAVAFSVALLAGLVKGIVGFAMPMVLLAGLGMFLPPDLALAGLILPTLVSNAIQALRQGISAALGSVARFWVFLGVGLVFLMGSAQLVPVLSPSAMLLIIGLPVTGFAALQLIGFGWHLSAPSKRIELALGAFTGFIGGMSGIWGPPTVMYLNALGTPKAEHLRVQGVIYGLGAVALLAAHLGSGVIRAETAPFSAALVVPALVGMWIGTRVQARINQKGFRKATNFVLMLAGVGLVARGVFG
ncbi:MAG: sulfite exporter TauE/SafE family protein [Rhodobacteraceae bacterium]|nr:sulfite exporter TauE/SafE family protein [Paracoccaceae bacterium]